MSQSSSFDSALKTAAPMVCQVEGCCANLHSDKRYCQKRRVCSKHMRADAVVRRGCGDTLWRYCFQCGKLEELVHFDGQQRSCRVRLEQRRRPRRDNSVSSGSSEGCAWPMAAGTAPAAKRARAAGQDEVAAPLPGAGLLAAGQGSMEVQSLLVLEEPTASGASAGATCAFAEADELLDQLLHEMAAAAGLEAEATSGCCSAASDAELDRLIEAQLLAAAAEGAASAVAPSPALASPGLSSGCGPALAASLAPDSAAAACEVEAFTARLAELQRQLVQVRSLLDGLRGQLGDDEQLLAGL